MTFQPYTADDRRDMLMQVIGQPDARLAARAVFIDDAIANGSDYFGRYSYPEQSLASYMAERDVLRTVLGPLDPSGDDE